MTTTTVRIDEETKDQATRIFNSLGLSFNAGINVYLKAVSREKKIPFVLELYSGEELQESSSDRP